MDAKLINREILLSFWKVHVLHHADEGEVIGQWMLKELAHHGYDVSPGTLYPLLKRMEKTAGSPPRPIPLAVRRLHAPTKLPRTGAKC